MKIRNVAIWLFTAATFLSIARAQEYPIADPDLRPAFGSQTAPSVAGNGADFLAVWTDARARVYDANVMPTPREEWDVSASRIMMNGSADSSGGVLVSPTSSRDDTPAVLWNGEEYVVVHPVTSWLNGMRSGVMFSRVKDGTREPGTFVPIGTDVVAPYGATLAAAWNGSEYLVIIGYRWPRLDAQDQPHVVRAFIADENFDVIRPSFDVSDPSMDSILPSVATDGSSFLVTWIHGGQDSQVRAAAVSPSAEVRRFDGALAIVPLHPKVHEKWRAPATWNGERYLVTWSDGASIQGRFVDREAAPVTGSMTIARSEGVEVFAPSSAWNGLQFLVAFAYRNEWFSPTQWPVTNIYAARLQGDGTKIDDPYPLTITTAPGEQTVSAVAASGDRFVVVWEGTGDIHSAVVDPLAGTVSTDALLTRSIARQWDGHGTFDGWDFAFLWTEDTDVLFGRMSVDGRTLDGAGVKLGTGTSRALVWNGSVFLAVWGNSALRISSGGVVLDAKPLMLSEGGALFASDEKDFLVVATADAGPGYPARHRLTTYVVSADGTMSSAAPVAPAEFSQVPASVAWNGSHYLVVYTQYFGDVCYTCRPEYEYRAILLDRQGRAAGLPFAVGLAGPSAAGAGRFIVTSYQWTARNEWSVGYTIIDEAGTLIRGSIKTSPRFPLRVIDASWDSHAFVIAAGTSLYRVSASGSLLEEKEGAIPAEALEARIIPVRGAVPLLIRRIEKLAPGIHEGGIERYVVFWTPAARGRAVQRH